MPKQHYSFRDDLRKTLLLHTVIPLFITVLLLFGALGIIQITHMANSSRNEASAAVSALLNEKKHLAKELVEIAGKVEENADDSQILGTDVISEIYKFANADFCLPDFYLMSKDGEILFGTQKTVSESKRRLLYWRGVRTSQPDSQAFGKLVRLVDEEGKPWIGWLQCLKTPVGFMLFHLDESSFLSMFRSYANMMIVTDLMDNIIYQSSDIFSSDFGKLRSEFQQKNGFVSCNGRQYYAACTDNQENEIRVYAIMDCTGMMAGYALAVMVVLFVFTAIILAIFFSTDRIVEKKVSSVNQIADFCLQVQNGDLQRRLNIHSGDEFETISHACNDMLDSVTAHMQREVALTKENTISKVKQLETEFNPHFLFNTLENIRYMIRLDPKSAETMVKNLSMLLRYSLEVDSETVPLSRELEYTRNYFQILDLRFGDRLGWKIECAEDIENIQVPRLIMQPIIENAVKYSMDTAPKVQVGVRISVHNEHVHIHVTDNGPGIDLKMLEELKAQMAQERRTTNKHVGILNVNERLRLLYGPQYGVRITTGIDGTDIILRVPVR